MNSSLGLRVIKRKKSLGALFLYFLKKHFYYFSKQNQKGFGSPFSPPLVQLQGLFEFSEIYLIMNHLFFLRTCETTLSQGEKRFIRSNLSTVVERFFSRTVPTRKTKKIILF